MAKEQKVLNLILISSLFLTACAKRTGPAPVTSVYRGNTIHDYKPKSLNSSQYIVQKGDTLYSIAFRAGVDYRKLAQMNGISLSSNIYPGQKLNLVIGNKNRGKKSNKKTTKLTKKIVEHKKQEEYVVNQGKQVVTEINNNKNNTSTFNIKNWQWPAEGKIIARFSNKDLGNKGLEISAKEGTPILAANSGKVVYAGNALRGYGNLIIIKHSDDYLSAYAHNKRILVKELQWIHVGQKIAEMGNSESDTVKLRFEIRFKGNTVNPEKFLPK
ncbi:peptidoglycan DD-metalloendopeptidase family protein [Catenovulum maritimum]|uniref:LysM domain-containing protein n=1 Tax=Catenovulum maritimum TaxID=1513271 RepID=A0A0J8GVQ3_9ALTE|nr:peptidoglycan DD-metalloendopeptidase family protein [Catenovulum maritimum]KMT65389.1 hypothetical protein XM47_08460 [Catenovulum maritimum]